MMEYDKIHKIFTFHIILSIKKLCDNVLLTITKSMSFLTELFNQKFHDLSQTHIIA